MQEGFRVLMSFEGIWSQFDCYRKFGFLSVSRLSLSALNSHLHFSKGVSSFTRIWEGLRVQGLQGNMQSLLLRCTISPNGARKIGNHIA